MYQVLQQSMDIWPSQCGQNVTHVRTHASMQAHTHIHLACEKLCWHRHEEGNANTQHLPARQISAKQHSWS